MQRPYIKASFPAGLSSEKYYLELVSVIQDRWGAETVVNKSVMVTQNNDVDVTVLASQALSTLTTSYATGNVNKVLSTVNNVASTLSAVNCSHALNCIRLFRSACIAVPQVRNRPYSNIVRCEYRLFSIFCMY